MSSKRPTWTEQTQRLRVIGDGARQAEQPGVALENQHANSGEAEQIRGHEPDRPGADDRDLDRERPTGVPRSVLKRHGFLRLRTFLLTLSVRSTK